MISKFATAILLLTVGSFTQTLLAHWSSRGMYMAINIACERAMAVLASACPCALGLAKPTAILNGLNAAQARGVIVKGGFASFKSLAELTHIVLDKTGTLTTGKLSVAASDQELCGMYRTLLCIAERDSPNHPVAQAVFQWAYRSLTLEQREQVSDAVVGRTENKNGNGVTCDVSMPHEEGVYTVHLGNTEFLTQHNIVPYLDAFKRSPDDKHTVVHLAIDEEYIGSLQLQDTARPDAPAVIKHLKNSARLQVSMLSGDTPDEAKRVSHELGIDNSIGRVTPLQKKLYIAALREANSYNCVAMMGDGLNDAPALAIADVGIALNIGSKGTAPSVGQATNAQVGDVIFTSPDLGRLPELLEIAKQTTAQASTNLLWAVAYNLVAVSLAMGLLEPVGLTLDASKAGTMMAFSSISVMAWGAWLQYELGKVSFQKMKEGMKLKGDII